MRLALFLLLALFPFSLFSAVNTSQVNVRSLSSANITTASYAELIASTSITISKLELCDTSTKQIKYAIGAAGNETDILVTPGSGCVVVPYFLPAGTRISAKAVDANATTGFNSIALVP